MKRYELISLTLKDNKTNEIKEVLYDELDIINLFNKLDTKWQKLKEFIKTNIENDEQEYDESKMPMFAHYLSVERFIINKMEELEGEDVED